jgi:oligopeptide/dipeptide ABC transporter ATP-binding protein
MDSNPLVQARDLSVSFSSNRELRQGRSVRAVERVNLDVLPGETLCLVGESGSGKTSLARTIGGLLRPSSGIITFDNRDISSLNGKTLHAFRRRVQFVFQDPYESLNPRQRVGEIVAEPLLVHGIARRKRDIEARVIESLEECGLSPGSSFYRTYPSELSGGQRQRVSIAAATILRPQLLIADEPVSMLDVSVRAGIIRLLIELRQAHNLTLLFITHDLSLAWAIGDRLAVMYAGRLLEVGTPQAVVGHPGHPYTSALLASIPSTDPSHRLPNANLKTDTSVGAPSGCCFRLRCPYAIERCAASVPELLDVSMSGEVHLSACLRHSELTAELVGLDQLQEVTPE